MNQNDLLALYSLLDSESPLKEDCGVLCGRACCQSGDETLCGVDLLDIEAQTLSNVTWADIVTDPFSGRSMLMCREACERDKRPWLCRIFPLCPVDSGKRIRVDARAVPVCPLAQYGVRSMLPEFRKAVSRSAKFLAQFEDGAVFLAEWETSEALFRDPLG